jgi:hypothetical protein
VSFMLGLGLPLGPGPLGCTLNASGTLRPGTSASRARPQVHTGWNCVSRIPAAPGTDHRSGPRVSE